jgi:hypothetical protein
MARDLEEKYVCPDCIDDYAIQEFIRNNAAENICSYCGKSSDQEIAASLDEVVDFMLDGIWSEWDDPANCVGWEGGWVGAEVIDSDELIRERVGLEYSNEDVLEDIIKAMPDQEWCQRDPYALREEEALFFSWNNFCEQVKHRSRYIFFRVDGDEDDEEQRRFYDPDEIPVSKMLDRISFEMSRLEYEISIVKSLPIGTELWRVRIHNAGETLNTANALGTVSRDKAIYSNRMSPAGIPMFYGALDPETALEETIDRTSENEMVASIATFKTLKEIKILDLTELPSVPSLFDQNNGHMRSILKFMHSFVADLSRPISKDGMEHIDYVPTQVFTEYIRYLYVSIEGDHILGIIYPSAKKEGGKSIVLFLENDACCDASQLTLDGKAGEQGKYLVLESVERRMS